MLKEFKFVITMCVVFIVSILSSGAKSKIANKSFSVDLIHRDSPSSPFYNASMSKSEVVINAALRSISRIKGFYSENDNAESPLVPNNGDYLIIISIGTPAVTQYVIADTGSDLIWVQCMPCINCYPQSDVKFDRNQSFTYKVESCNSAVCNLVLNHNCGQSNECRYSYSYGDGSKTNGELANEVINLYHSTDGQLHSLNKTLFGCGYENSGIFDSGESGMVGLGRGNLSLISQQGEKIGKVFSYCMVSPFSGNHSKSVLTFSTEPTLTGSIGVVSTPIFTFPKRPSFYYLKLEHITINEDTLNLDEDEQDIFIDSGTTLTTLKPSIYKIFEQTITSHIYAQQVLPPGPYKVCYGQGAREKIPDIVFKFSSNDIISTSADITLKVDNVFLLLPTDKIICLAIIPSEDNYSILGNIAQVNFMVEYDIPGKKISFSPKDCTQ